MSYCLNPDCEKPHNPDDANFCQSCGTELVLLGGHYRIIRLLSDEGGFGRTYLAEDEQKLNEHCVVKQLVPQLQGNSGMQKAVELFAEEAKRLQQLGEHPQIPTLYAYFSQDNYFYLVQQYIEGQNLLQELRHYGSFSERQIREVLLEILPVLQFIHEQKVIHRDIKPQNIMRRHLVPTLDNGMRGELVLIDFGASKLLQETVKQKIATRIGSEGYAPIEQMRGGEAHPASDLFSLGVTCFHLLTQRHPFDLWTEHGYSWVQNWQIFLKSPIGEELGYILDKLLQRDIERRYQSANEAIADLMSHPPAYLSPAIMPNIQQPKPSFHPPRSKQKKTRRQNQVMLGSALLLGLIGYGYFKFIQPVSEFASQANVKSAQIDPWEKVAEAQTLTGHLSAVNSIAFSSDGQTLASGSADNTVKLWNWRTGQEIRTFTGHVSQVNSIAFSPDRETLASGSEDNTIKLWNLTTGQEIRTLKGHSSSVNSVAFSPDGQTLASGSLDNTIKVWNWRTGQEIRTLKGHSSSVYSVAYARPYSTRIATGYDNSYELRTGYGNSSEGDTLASGSYDNTIKLWNLKTGQEIRTLRGHSSWVFAVAFSPDGQTLASSSWDRTIKVWNWRTGQEIGTLIGHSNWVFSIAFSPDGQTLASGSWDRTIKVWDWRTGQEIGTLRGHLDRVHSIAFSPDGKTLASGSWDNTIKIWQLPQ